MRIPRGKEIEILVNGVPVLSNNIKIAPNIRLRQEEDLIVQASSDFQEIFAGGGNFIVDAIGGAARDVFGFGFSSQFKEFGFQIWKRSQPLVLNLTFSFYMGMANIYSGLREVELPIKELMKLTLPEEGGALGSLIPPGPSILNLLGGGTTTLKGKIVSIRIGNILRLSNVVVTRVEPTFSKEKDTNGNSIEGKAQLEIKTLFNATTNMLDTSQAEFDASLSGFEG